MTLPDVVHRFKSFKTTKYRQGVKQSGWPAFGGRLWQRNYYEHVIRNDESMEEIRDYVRHNPLKWDDDMENLECRVPIQEKTNNVGADPRVCLYARND